MNACFNSTSTDINLQLTRPRLEGPHPLPPLVDISSSPLPLSRTTPHVCRQVKTFLKGRLQDLDPMVRSLSFSFFDLHSSIYS